MMEFPSPFIFFFPSKLFLLSCVLMEPVGSIHFPGLPELATIDPKRRFRGIRLFTTCLCKL